MWLHLEPDWNLLWNQLYTEWPGIHTYDEINDRLFVNPGRNENILDVKSKVGRNSPEYWQWMGQIDYMWQFQDGQVLPVQVKMEDAIAEYQANLRKEQAEVALHRPLVRKQWKTKDGTFQVFFSPLPLLLAYGTMGIEMAIAPLWVKGKRKMTESSKIRTKLYSEKCHMSGKPNTCCAAS